MASDTDILESLVAGGIVGAALGALLSNKNKVEGVALGTIASAALLATYKANLAAKNAHVPLYFEEEGCLYEMQTTGVKRLIRKIEKPTEKLQAHFKLK
jgi:uncharacterized membrane protein (UPF0136 family)